MNAISGIADTIFRALKIFAIIAVCATFMVAIHTLLNLISVIIFGGVISEFFALISMYLPFDASVVFSSIGLAIVAILSFLCARKVFQLTSWSILDI